MGAKAFLIVQASVAHHRVLLGCHGAYFIVHPVVYAGHIVVGHTVQGYIELFVGVHQVIAEVFLQGQMAIELETRLDA